MKISNLPAFRLLTVLATVVVLLTGIPVATQADKPLRFVAVNVNDKDYTRADTELVKRLRDKTAFDFAEEPQEKYGRMIRRLLELKKERYVARVTPYVYVVAEMMGAEFEVLATYKNMTDRTTYYSWFVVNRSYFPDLTVAPTVDQLFEKLREQSSPPKFIYHDKFSTSSYFLPSLEFRRRNVFSMGTSTGDLIAIHSEKAGSSSTALVEKVANNEAFLAAVWDGTKNKFDNKPEATKVFFVKIPTALPNDLLVCSAHLDQATRTQLRKAIGELGEINIWDFQAWSDIRSESTAKEALAALRHSAEQRPAPVTVRIGSSQSNPSASLLATMETIKHAVRLSGTEMVPFDPHFHKRHDVDWNVELIHDGAINLTSTITNTNLAAQQYQISFTDGEDLTKRIGSFLHSRMHRIRYIWPYDDERPTVVRDTAFPISAETQVKVMSITWTDPQKNAFSDGDSFDANVVEPTPFGFQLASSAFPKNGNFYDFDPMSNVSYRVVLVRSSGPGRMFTVLTYGFVGLLLLAAAGAFFDMRRKAKKPGYLPLVNTEDFKRMCRELAEKYRSFWRKHELTEADVLWCDRPRLEKIIADLKVSDLNSVTVWTRSMAILANIPVVSKLLGLTVGAGVTEITTVNPEKFSDAQRLEDTIKYLMAKGALSPFIGEKLECDALNEIASNIFKPFSLATSQAGNTNGGELIRNEHPMLVSLIAKHFNGVIQESKEKVCFFGRKWTVTANETEQILVCTADLLTPIKLNGGNSAVPKTVQKLTLRAQVSRDADLCDLSQGNEVNAWLFGKIHRVEPPRNGDGNLFLNFKPAALVRTDDSE